MTKWVTIVLIGLFGILQYKLWIGSGSIQDVHHLNEAITQQNDELARLAERNRQLDAEVKALKADPKAFEERARAELGMIKEDETFCLIIETQNNQ